MNAQNSSSKIPTGFTSFSRKLTKKSNRMKDYGAFDVQTSMISQRSRDSLTPIT